MGKKVEDAISREIKRLDKRLEEADPLFEEESYAALLARRRELCEMREKPFIERISPDALVKAGTTLAVVVGIMAFESFGHVFTSKASSFIPRPF